jgi:hypothetical protein
MSEADLRAVLQAADRMYNAIRQYFAAEGFDEQASADRELFAACNGYDTASENAGPSPLVSPPDVSRN